MYLSDAGGTQEIPSQGPLSIGTTSVAQITELQTLRQTSWGQTDSHRIEAGATLKNRELSLLLHLCCQRHLRQHGQQ